MNTDKTKGFTETFFATPFPVVAFPSSNSFHPTPCKALGIEKCNTFGSERLIVSYDTSPVRKSSGKAESWPNGRLYLAPRDVSGWEPAKKETA